MAIADQHGLRAFRMAFRDDPHEFRFGIGDVGERLRRLGIGIENVELAVVKTNRRRPSAIAMLRLIENFEWWLPR